MEYRADPPPLLSHSLLTYNTYFQFLAMHLEQLSGDALFELA